MNCQTISSLKPLGLFWDINDCFIPLTLTTSECIKQMRNFISNQFNNNCIEYEFCCLLDPKLINESIAQSLIENGCTVRPVDSDSQINVFIELDQMIKEFVENYGFDTIVVIISNNPYLSSTILSVQHREVSVLLISGQKPNERHSDWITFNDVFQLNRTVILSVTNIPNDKSRKTIRDSFIPFCRQFNCKFRFNRRDSVRLEFNNAIDAKKAELRLNELQYFNQQLNVEIIETEVQSNGISSPSVPSSICSLASVAVTKQTSVLPQNDDKCKSVIIGLFTKFNQNVCKFVQNLVKSWNDPSIDESMIFRVNRERDFIGRDGRASLIVTAVDRQSNHKLITAAKKSFVDRQKKLYWNRLQRSKRNSNETNVSQSSSNEHKSCDENIGKDCKSIITGLWTRHNENVLKTVRNLVKGWNIYKFDIRHIICVERSHNFNRFDGKARLIVSTDSPENNRRILEYVSQKMDSKCKKFNWRPFPTDQCQDSLQSSNRCLMEKKDTNCYSSIPFKPLIIENSNSTKSMISAKKVDPIVEMRYRRRNIDSKCNCQ